MRDPTAGPASTCTLGALLLWGYVAGCGSESTEPLRGDAGPTEERDATVFVADNPDRRPAPTGHAQLGGATL